MKLVTQNAKVSMQRDISFTYQGAFDRFEKPYAILIWQKGCCFNGDYWAFAGY